MVSGRRTRIVSEVDLCRGNWAWGEAAPAGGEGAALGMRCGGAAVGLPVRGSGKSSSEGCSLGRETRSTKSQTLSRQGQAATPF